MAEKAKVAIPPGPAPTRRSANLAANGLDAHWIFAYHQFAELVYGVLQRCRESPAKESDADPFDPGVRFHSQGHELEKRTVKTGPTGKRLLGGQFHNL